jgi:Fe-Mn family superoxide dismutase
MQTYINNLNGVLDKFPELKELGLVDLNKAVATDKLPKDAATIIRNNGGGHYNHSFFWKVRRGHGDLVKVPPLPFQGASPR